MTWTACVEKLNGARTNDNRLVPLLPESLEQPGRGQVVGVELQDPLARRLLEGTVASLAGAAPLDVLVEDELVLHLPFE